jgi:hypothetical protein
LIRKPPFPAQIVSVEGDVCELSALLDNKDYLDPMPRRIIPVPLIAAVRLVVGSEAAPRAGPPGATGRVLMLPIRDVAPCWTEKVSGTFGREFGNGGAVRELMLLDGTDTPIELRMGGCRSRHASG